jgi:uncharacterized protein (DUF488 family)
MSRIISDQAVFTIGYQGHTVSSIIGVLQAHQINLLIDVRQNPISRKPGFSKKGLDKHLSFSGIDYVHFPCLGTPLAIRRFYIQSGQVELALKRYEKYLESKTACLQSLVEIVSDRRCCLLCLESCYTTCHRSVIAKKLARITQWTPVHLT